MKILLHSTDSEIFQCRSTDGFTAQGNIPVIELRVIMPVSRNWMELAVRWVREGSWNGGDNHHHNVLKGTNGEGNER